jgi:hypothetical protein
LVFTFQLRDTASIPFCTSPNATDSPAARAPVHFFNRSLTAQRLLYHPVSDLIQQLWRNLRRIQVRKQSSAIDEHAATAGSSASMTSRQGSQALAEGLRLRYRAGFSTSESVDTSMAGFA